ncbi:hypothetical protein [Paenibacillus tianjinensis]|uniref:Uncharacterized protein n=1 Tax=Paenibacillus tianjinensis TaxID=2810347 RepID=A0ABX7LDT5_9BACL|nr:hypothetical protein [Paenibacillus tianjinensis]QSF44998.1 hypothetical protein JRJ22_28345 [Paenibacillus tianjinensis]
MIELDKQFTRRLAIMLESGLIWYEHYFMFCDEIIERLDKPPYWIIDLAVTSYNKDAERIVNNYAFSEPFEAFEDSLFDLHIGCLFLRYERREISWSAFLKASGDFADGYQTVKNGCGFFYDMLNMYAHSEYSADLEFRQAEIIQEDFKDEISEARGLYAPFADYFRKYVLSFKGQSEA